MAKQLRTGTMQRGSSPVLRLRGITFLVGCAAALVSLTALVAPGWAAAEAGSDAGPDARYYRSSIKAIEPAAPGLDVMLHGEGQVMVTNGTGKTVTVLGYSGEPYLRIRPTAVQENANSLSAALNKSDGRTAPPQKLTGAKQLPVKWVTTARSNSVMWRDYRVRWSADTRPPIVANDPYSPHQVFEWVLQLEVDKKQTLVRGVVDWTGMPAPPQKTHYPVAIAIGVAALLAVVALFALASGRRRRHERERVRREPEYATSRFIGVRN